MSSRPRKYLLSVVITIFILFFANETKSQYLENDPTPSQRIFWGGNIGLMFGSNTYVSIDPIIGYRLTNRLSAGVGINYSWTHSSYYDYSGQSYGGNVFASFTLIKNLGEALPFSDSGGLLLYGELSLVNISDYYAILPMGQDVWAYTPLAGIAYQTPIGSRSYMLIMFLYNFNESSVSPYPNPVIKVCFQY